MALNQNDKMEQLVEHFNTTDLDEKNICEETLPPHSQISSSRFSVLRATPKKREIKDVAKDNILPLLPAKTLIRFRSVSKEWDQWITSPLFAFHQSYIFRELSGFFCQLDEGNYTFLSLNHPAYGVPTSALRILPEHVHISSSSGGLLLCRGLNGNVTYYICNPATQDWKELPEPELYHNYNKSATVLAFEPSVRNIHANYQVICAVPLVDHPVVCFEVYSSELRSWRQSGAICVEFGDSNFTGNGFYMKGMAYWVMSTRKVLAFDVDNESYEIISLPSNCPHGGVLAQMNGELCYIGISNPLGNDYLIKIYGGMELRLKRTIEVHLDLEYSNESRTYQVLPCFRDGEVAILVGSLIYSYRLSDQRIELISREGMGSSLAVVNYLPYVNSLVSVV